MLLAAEGGPTWSGHSSQRYLFLHTAFIACTPFLILSCTAFMACTPSLLVKNIPIPPYLYAF